jgi:hypothetical protein
MCSCNIFGAWMYHGHTQTHKTHHGLNLGEDTTFPLIVFYVHGHGDCTQMSFCPGTFKLWVSKFSKLRLSQLWKSIFFFAKLRLRWHLNQSCSPRQDFSKYMWHATYAQINQGDSWLLVVGSQIGILTPNLSFNHNLCFKYLNGSCELIFDIHVSRAFKWYK